jgi:hypothetical protein|nr:MAG TPA: hypothetical protein [Caudoviricetes sp.]
MATINLKYLVRNYPQYIGYADERTTQGFQGIHIYVFDKVRKVALDTNVIVGGMRTPLTEEQRYKLNKTLERLRYAES